MVSPMLKMQVNMMVKYTVRRRRVYITKEDPFLQFIAPYSPYQKSYFDKTVLCDSLYSILFYNNRIYNGILY